MLSFKLRGIFAALLFLTVTLGCAPDEGNTETKGEVDNGVPAIDVPANIATSSGSHTELNLTLINIDESKASFSWAQISGDDVALIYASEKEATFVAPLVSQELALVFEVTIIDQDGVSYSAQTTVTIYPVLSKLNDTGVLLCGDYAFQQVHDIHNNNVACGLEYEIANGGDPVPPAQDGEFGNDLNSPEGSKGFSFTKLDKVSGAELSSNATDWGCTQDNVTGLVWEVKTSEAGLRNHQHLYSWYQPDSTLNGGFAGFGDTGLSTTTVAHATGSDQCFDGARCDSEKFVADVNALAEPLCGYSDWRMPTLNELKSVVNYGEAGLSIDRDYFPNTLNDFYWTSTPYAAVSNNAWLIHFGEGFDYDLVKSQPRGIRLVRN